MGRATEDQLAELHQTVARALRETIDNSGDGGPSASILNVARQFLNDNGIETKPGSGSETDNLGKSISELPFPEASDTAAPGDQPH